MAEVDDGTRLFAVRAAKVLAVLLVLAGLRYFVMVVGLYNLILRWQTDAAPFLRVRMLHQPALFLAGALVLALAAYSPVRRRAKALVGSGLLAQALAGSFVAGSWCALGGSGPYEHSLFVAPTPLNYVPVQTLAVGVSAGSCGVQVDAILLVLGWALLGAGLWVGGWGDERLLAIADAIDAKVARLVPGAG